MFFFSNYRSFDLLSPEMIGGKTTRKNGIRRRRKDRQSARKFK